MPEYRVICTSTKRSSKTMCTKKEIKAYIKEERRIDKIMTRKRKYITYKPVKL